MGGSDMESTKDTCSLKESSLARVYRGLLLFLFICLAATRIIFVLWGYMEEVMQIAICLAACFAVMYGFRRKTILRERIGNLCLILASVYAMSFFVAPTRNVIWAILAALIFYLYRSLSIMEFQKLSSSLAYFISMLFSLAVFLGSQLVSYGRLEILYFSAWEELRLYKLFFYAFQFLGLNGLFYGILYRIFYNLSSTPPSFVKSHRYKLKVWAAVPALTALFLVCWLPYFIAYYPGIYHPDSLGEMDAVMGYGELINHHPFFHLMFIKLCLYIGGFFGSVEAGLVIYSCLQMLIQAAVFSGVLIYLAGKQVSSWLLYPLGLFLAIYMASGLYSVYMVKDVLFGCICLAALVMLTEETICRENGLRKGIGWLLALTAVLFLFCISRNNGVYAFIIGFTLYTLANKKYIKRYAIIFVTVMLLFVSYNYLIYNVLGVTKGRTAEMLSVPLQQIARTVKLYPEELESPEVQVLTEVFPDIEGLGDLYKTYISDPVKEKGVFDSEAFDRNPLRYAKAWLGLGLRHVRTYIDAMFLQCYGYFYPDLDVGGTIELGLTPESYGILRDESGVSLRSRIVNTYGNYSSRQPTAVFHSIGFAVWIIIISVGIFVVTGRSNLAAPCFILLGKWLTILLSPVFCEFRYVYCLFLCAPVVLVMALGLEVQRNNPKLKED